MEPSTQINFNTLDPTWVKEMFKTNPKGVLVNHFSMTRNQDNETKSYDISIIPNNPSNWHTKPGKWYYEICGWLTRVWQWIRSPETARLKNLRDIVACKYMEATPDSVSRIFLAESVMDLLNNAIQKHNQNRWFFRITPFRNYESSEPHPLSYTLSNLFDEKIQAIGSLEDAKSAYDDFEIVKDLIGRLHPESNSTKMSKSIKETYAKFLAENQAQAQISELSTIAGFPYSLEGVVNNLEITIPKPLDDSSLDRLEENTKTQLTNLRAQATLVKEAVSDLYNLTKESSEVCKNLLDKEEKEFEKSLKASLEGIATKINHLENQKIETFFEEVKAYVCALRDKKEVENPVNLDNAKNSLDTIQKFYEKAVLAQLKFNKYPIEKNPIKIDTAKIGAAYYKVILEQHLQKLRQVISQGKEYKKFEEEKHFEEFLNTNSKYKESFENLKIQLHTYEVAYGMIKALDEDNTTNQANHIIHEVNTKPLLKEILSKAKGLQESFRGMFKKKLDDLILSVKIAKDVEFKSPLLFNAADLAKLYESWIEQFDPVNKNEVLKTLVENKELKNGLMPLATLHAIGANLEKPDELDKIIFDFENLHLEEELASQVEQCRTSWPCILSWKDKVREKPQKVYEVILKRIQELDLTPESIQKIKEINCGTVENWFTKILTMCSYINSHYQFLTIINEDTSLNTKYFEELTEIILKTAQTLVINQKNFIYNAEENQLQREFAEAFTQLQSYEKRIAKVQKQDKKIDAFITIFDTLSSLIKALNRKVQTPSNLLTYTSPPSSPRNTEGNNDEDVLPKLDSTAPLTPKRKDQLKKKEPSMQNPGLHDETTT